MKYLLLSLLFLVAGCSIVFGGPVKEFEGFFQSVDSPDKLTVDCSDYAQRGDFFNGSGEAFTCFVEISENTIIQTEEGETLTVEDLEKIEAESTTYPPPTVRIILSEERNIGQDSPDSLKGLKADEIIFLE